LSEGGQRALPLASAGQDERERRTEREERVSERLENEDPARRNRADEKGWTKKRRKASRGGGALLAQVDASKSKSNLGRVFSALYETGNASERATVTLS